MSGRAAIVPKDVKASYLINKRMSGILISVFFYAKNKQHEEHVDRHMGNISLVVQRTSTRNTVTQYTDTNKFVDCVSNTTIKANSHTPTMVHKTHKTGHLKQKATNIGI